MTESSALLREYVVSGSDAAFTELTVRHTDLVYAAAWRIVGKDAALAADVVQLVFTDLARKAPQLPAGVVLSGWLYRHACFTASKVVRSEKRRQARERQAVEMQALQGDESVWRQLAPVLDEAMGHLAPDSRNAIVLRFFERQPLRQVGQALGVSEDNARKRVERAVAALRKYLFRHGLALPAATLTAALAAKAASAAPAGLAAEVAGSALASAAAIHTAALGLATKALVMTTLQKVAVATVVAAALGATIYEARRAHHSEQQIQRLQQQSPSLATAAGLGRPGAKAAAAAAPVTTFDWRQVESEDYRQYTANLRAIGCPEKTVRDIVMADVNDLFRQRLKAALAPTNRFEYWKPKSEAQLQSELVSKPQELAREKRELLKSLLGDNVSEQADVSSMQVRWNWMMERMWDFLTPEKQTAVMELTQQFGTRLMSTDRFDAEGERKILAEQDAELLKVLTPEDKFEWDLRSSRTAAFMKAKMGEFEPTEQEYREMFRLQKQYDDQYGPPGFAVVRGDSGDAARRAAEETLQNQLQRLLGAERYRQYSYESRWEFDVLRSIAAEHNVSKERAFKAYDIEKETLAQARGLSEQLPEAQRQAALAAMATEAGQAVEQLLGPAAGPKYVKLMQERGYLRTLQP